MHPQLMKLLESARAKRAFDVDTYVNKKCKAINKYFTECRIDSCVVGISGGVDSAVVLGLLGHASQQPGSPIKRIVAARLPVSGIGTSNQTVASERGGEAIYRMNVIYGDVIKPWSADLSHGLNSIATMVEHGSTDSHVNRNAWAYGQISSIIRTPALYYIAALLQDNGNNCAVVVGTTNRSEGAYIGFFGKASDAMVDIQPISDIHKSEVYEVAKYLHVPDSIIQAVPAGDVWDGQTDEQMFGSTYEHLELYQLVMTSKVERIFIGCYLCADALSELRTHFAAIEKIHKRNAHKYRVGSPAVHFDIMERTVPGGWEGINLQLIA